jgi:hypothetical protein
MLKAVIDSEPNNTENQRIFLKEFSYVEIVFRGNKNNTIYIQL